MARPQNRLNEKDLITYKDFLYGVARHYYLGQYNMYKAYYDAFQAMSNAQAPTLEEAEVRIFQYTIRVMARMVRATYADLVTKGYDVDGLPQVDDAATD